jgi:hypothetical protein
MTTDLEQLPELPEGKFIYNRPHPNGLLNPTEFYFTADQMHAYALAALAQSSGADSQKSGEGVVALSQPAGVDLEQFRDVVNHYLSYYRGSLRLAEDSLSPITCGANDLFQRRIDTATRLLVLIDAQAAAPAASGGEDEIDRAARRMGDSARELLHDIAQQQSGQPPPGASVSERARAAFAEWHRRKGCGQEVVDDCLSGSISMPDLYMEVLGIALSSPRQEGEANGKLVGWWNGIMPDVTERSPYGPSVRWGAGAEDSAHDIPLYDGYNPIHYQTPTSNAASTAASTQGLRELVERWRGPFAFDGHDGEDYDRGVRETLLNCADDLESLLTSPTTGADGGVE